MLNLFNYIDDPYSLPKSELIPHMQVLSDLSTSKVLNDPHAKEKLKPVLDIIKKSAKTAVKYAMYILKGRFKEAEPNIIKSGMYANLYLRFVLSKDPEWVEEHENGRWREAEPAIMKDSGAAYQYALLVLHQRWDDAEPYIMKEPEIAFNYAKNIIKGRWEEAEEYIEEDEEAWDMYKRQFGL